MINILIDELPTTVTIGDCMYPIRTSFRICILFEQLMFDAALSDADKFLQALTLFYGENVPEDLPHAFEQILWLYFAERKQTAQQSRGQSKSERAFDYDQDAHYIYAAFWSDYHIDLQDSDLHWWKFKALLDALSADTMFSKIVSWRTTDIKKMKGEQRKSMEQLQRIYALKQPEKDRTALDEIAHRLMTTGEI